MVKVTLLIAVSQHGECYQIISESGRVKYIERVLVIW